MQIKEYRSEIRDTIWLVILQGLNYVAPILVLPYLMIVLNADGYGKIGFAQSFCQYLMIVVDFGFNYTATKQIAIAKGNQNQIDKIFSNTFRAKLSLLILSAIIMFGISAIPQYATYRSTLYVMFLMVVGQCFSCFWLFQGLGKVRIISLINCIAKLSILPLTFLFVKTSDDVLIAAAIHSSVFIATAIVSLIIIHIKGYANWTQTSHQETKLCVHDSFPVFISAAATSVYVALFIIILGYFSSEAEVGRYAAADKIMRIACYIVWLPISQAFFPKISQLGETNREQAFKLINRLILIIVCGMSIIGITLYISAPYIIPMLGESYKNCETLLQIVCIVPLFVGIGGCCGQFGLIALGQEKQKKTYRNIYLIAATLALICVFPLTIQFEATGTSIAIVITESIVALMMVFAYLRFKKTDGCFNNNSEL